MNRVTLLVGLLFNSLLAGAAMIGGQVPVLNSVSSIGVVSLDIAQGGVNNQIASFIVNNNTTAFILDITFVNGGNFINRETGVSVPMRDLTITESGNGSLGEGITPLVNKDMLPLINNKFIWSPENQKKATVNYGLKIIAGWDVQNLLSGLYYETIITSIQAVF